MFSSIIKSIKESFTTGLVSVGDVEDPDAPFKWARRCGITRDPRAFSRVRLHPLSVGGGQPYDGKNGPAGFTTRDTEMIDSFIRAAAAQGKDVAGWVIESIDGAEWQRCDGSWEKNG
jgi:hypothetical protein